VQGRCVHQRKLGLNSDGTVSYVLGNFPRNFPTWTGKSWGNVEETPVTVLHIVYGKCLTRHGGPLHDFSSEDALVDCYGFIASKPWDGDRSFQLADSWGTGDALSNGVLRDGHHGSQQRLRR